MRLLTLLVAVTLGAGMASAQDLGRIARQERERRAALGKRALVITNEDVQRPRILQPPGEPVASHRAVDPGVERPPAAQRPPAPMLDSEVPLWKVAEQPGFSLGEYARRLREWQATRRADAELAGTPSHRPLSPPLGLWPEPGAPFGSEFSLADYARQLEAERRLERSAQAGDLDAPLPPASPETAPDTPDPILVRRGDSLWKLSKVYLGDGKLWVSLWNANPEIRNPSLIHPGQLLRWPAADVLARNALPTPARAGAAARVRASLSSSGVNVAPQVLSTQTAQKAQTAKSAFSPAGPVSPAKRSQAASGKYQGKTRG